MLFGKKPKSVTLTNEEVNFIQESDRLLSEKISMSVDPEALRLRGSLHFLPGELTVHIDLTGGEISSKQKVIISDIKTLVSFAVKEFEKSLKKIRGVVEIQSIGGDVQSSLSDKEKRHKEALDIGKGILKKLEELQ